MEGLGGLRRAASAGSVQASVALTRLAQERKKDADALACETHLTLTEVGSMLLRVFNITTEQVLATSREAQFADVQHAMDYSLRGALDRAADSLNMQYSDTPIELAADA